ncbi:hypothetical protein LCGC14_1348490 [marine sediment metagenome]|uniref:Uncharacterized protein n=1 Tax=marine sediment metagenome TaxID=412755 RepID=A0A0F9NDV8_9ZZZZ
MSKRSKGSHGVYSLTCISQKCGRKFGVMWDAQVIKQVGIFSLGPKHGRTKLVSYPFTGCPWCGAWWPTGPLDGEAYPKRPPLPAASWESIVTTPIQTFSNKGLAQPWWETRWTW